MAQSTMRVAWASLPVLYPVVINIYQYDFHLDSQLAAHEVS